MAFATALWIQSALVIGTVFRISYQQFCWTVSFLFRNPIGSCEFIDFVPVYHIWRGIPVPCWSNSFVTSLQHNCFHKSIFKIEKERDFSRKRYNSSSDLEFCHTSFFCFQFFIVSKKIKITFIDNQFLELKTIHFQSLCSICTMKLAVRCNE